MIDNGFNVDLIRNLFADVKTAEDKRQAFDNAIAYFATNAVAEYFVYLLGEGERMPEVIRRRIDAYIEFLHTGIGKAASPGLAERLIPIAAAAAVSERDRLIASLPAVSPNGGAA